MDKYGFIYLWRDRKHKRYYVGSHWGTEDDGYICSSTWMKTSFLRRPDDFKRKILARIYTSRLDLIEEEYRWLSMIKPEEVKVRYFNLNLHKQSHWYTDPDKLKTVGEKISRAHARPETKAKASASKLGDKNPMRNPDVVAKAHTKRKAGQHIAWNKGLTKETHLSVAQYGKNSSKTKKANPAPSKTLGMKRSEATKKKIAESQADNVFYFHPETMHMIRIHKDMTPPDGYIRGRIVRGKLPTQSKQKGKYDGLWDKC